MTALVVIFGGTFDPVHNGHVDIARQVLERTAAEAVWFVPAGTPNLRLRPQASAAARLELVEAALAEEPRFHALDLDVRRPGISYTAGTMEELHARHPAAQLALLLGADAARGIGTWRHSAQLLRDERFLVVNRSGSPPLDDQGLQEIGFRPERTTLLNIDSPLISSTEVRRRVARGDSIRHLVPPAVAAMIAGRGLYGPAQPVHNAGG